MSARQISQLSGLALLIGVVLSLVSSIVTGVVFPDTSSPEAASNPLNVLLSVLGVLGTMLVLLGLPGLYARAATDGGVMWLVGVVLIAITGMLFGVFFGLMGALVFPVLATAAPDLFRSGPPPSFAPVFIIATLANMLGALLMGIPMITRRIYPRWCGYLLILEAVFAALGFVLNGPQPSLLGQVLNVISPVPLFVVLGWGGYELWSDSRPRTQPITTSVAPGRA